MLRCPACGAEPRCAPLARGAQLMDPYRTGFRGLLWKAARCVRELAHGDVCACADAPLRSIGERLSPYVAASCIMMGLSILWY